MTFQFHTLQQFIPEADIFRNHYDLVRVIKPVASNKKDLKYHRERTCRFCHRSSGETTFKMEAHLISELLGNKLLYSDFECDRCNEYFKTLENDLANYLGIVRTLTGIKGKEKVPTFKSAGKEIRVERLDVTGEDRTIITREEVNNDAIRLDLDKGLIHVKFQDNPFTPKNVYRGLLKIALSLLDEPVIATAYQRAIEFLMGELDMNGCVIGGFQFPFNTAFSPYALFFQKKDPQAIYHTHVMMLYVQNFIFHLPLPLHVNDLSLYDGSTKMSLLSAVPFVNEKTSPDLIIEPFSEDLSSNDRKDKRNSGLTFQFDPSEATGDTSGALFNPDEVVKIVMKNN